MILTKLLSDFIIYTKNQNKLKTQKGVHNAKEIRVDATIGAPAARVCRPAVRGLHHGEAVGGL